MKIKIYVADLHLKTKQYQTSYLKKILNNKLKVKIQLKLHYWFGLNVCQEREKERTLFHAVDRQHTVVQLIIEVLM